MIYSKTTILFIRLFSCYLARSKVVALFARTIIPTERDPSVRIHQKK